MRSAHLSLSLIEIDSFFFYVFATAVTGAVRRVFAHENRSGIGTEPVGLQRWVIFLCIFCRRVCLVLYKLILFLVSRSLTPKLIKIRAISQYQVFDLDKS